MSGANGGKDNLRESRPQKEILRELLSLEVADEEQKKTLTEMGLDPSIAGQINLSVIKKAVSGDITAARYIRDTIGEKPALGSRDEGGTDTDLDNIDLSALSDGQLRALAEKRQKDWL